MLPAVIIGLIALMGISMGLDVVFDRVQAPRLANIQSDIEQASIARAALIDAEDSVRGYVMSGRLEYLEDYLADTEGLGRISPTLLAQLDSYVSASTGVAGGSPSASGDITTLRKAWDSAVRQAGDNQRNSAEMSLLSPSAKEAMDRLRAQTAGFIRHLRAQEAEVAYWSNLEQMLLQILNVGGAIFVIIAMIYAFRSITRAITTGFAAKQQIEQLFSMADMLQSAAGQEDTNEVLRNTAANLLPRLSVVLYVFNNSRDRLDLSMRWGDLAEAAADHLSPASCWALRRGKPHLNLSEEGALRCAHVVQDQIVLEVPMAARGQLYGLLCVISEGADAAERLNHIRPIANAMGDAMSLALSSIALREQLRSQALRDPLTGLYNRRFLEEIQERMCLDAERRRTSISAIMIDLDHFKRLNDEHGHAAGDAALRDVAAAILSCLRSSDVVCRYGGEELAVLLSDCSLAAATGKAEQIRTRISEFTSARGVTVTASLGVASIPETSNEVADLLPAADAALYQAKQHGRDRVAGAPVLRSAKRLSLIDAETAVPTE
ncbi:MAG TPA: diguanylate cyclase [Stellaceae bacterium]|nr:diguanylate cyclase [Stellaceae bacterium]